MNQQILAKPYQIIYTSISQRFGKVFSSNLQAASN